MMVGFEWLVDAVDCDENSLREVETLRGVFACIISDLQLKTVGEGIWHKFDGEGGVTGLTMLTESHLACHTYPEHRTATFNLYCCRERPEWDWEKNLKEFLGAKKVIVEKIERGSGQSRNAILNARIAEINSRIEQVQADIDKTQTQIEATQWEILEVKAIHNPNVKIVGGEH
jgi:S-adenosylmethionine decarboxylase